MVKKILLIEDSPVDAECIIDMLARFKYEVLLAFDGKTGVELAISANPDLIIIDTVLPDIDGFEVCSRIRIAREALPPKIIIITSKLEAIDVTKAKRSGADDYAIKTNDGSMLLQAIMKLSQ